MLFLFTVPDICLPSVENRATFVITKSSKSENIIAFPLRDSTNLNAELSFLANYALHSNFKFASDNAVNYEQIKLPYLDEKLSYSLMTKINFLRQKKNDACEYK